VEYASVALFLCIPEPVTFVQDANLVPPKMKHVICFSVKAGEMPSRGKENTSEINPVELWR